MRQRKVIALLLCLLWCLSACGDTPDSPTTDPSESEPSSTTVKKGKVCTEEMPCAENLACVKGADPRKGVCTKICTEASACAEEEGMTACTTPARGFVGSNVAATTMVCTESGLKDGVCYPYQALMPILKLNDTPYTDPAILEEKPKDVKQLVFTADKVRFGKDAGGAEHSFRYINFLGSTAKQIVPSDIVDKDVIKVNGSKRSIEDWQLAIRDYHIYIHGEVGGATSSIAKVDLSQKPLADFTKNDLIALDYTDAISVVKDDCTVEDEVYGIRFTKMMVNRLYEMENASDAHWYNYIFQGHQLEPKPDTAFAIKFTVDGSPRFVIFQIISSPYAPKPSYEVTYTLQYKIF